MSAADVSPAPATDARGMLTDVDDRDAYRTDDMPELDEATQTALRTPVNPEWCELKPAGGRELVYVPWMRYQEVLIAAFGVGGFRLIAHPKFPPRQVGNYMTYRAALMVRPRGSTQFHYIGEAVGGNPVFEKGSPADAVEGAMSDCLTKCTKRLGIFMELFDPDWRRRYEAHFKREHKGSMEKPAPLPKPAPVGGATSVAEVPPGEAATPEAYEAVKGVFKARKLGGALAAEFLGVHFGVKKITALTAAQADAAHVLAMAWQTPAFERVRGELVAKGTVRP